MKYAIAFVVGALIAFVSTGLLVGASETGLIAAVEFVVLSCLLLGLRWLLTKFANWRINPYLMFALALLSVVYVSFSTAV